MVEVRSERPEDRDAVWQVNRAAFDQPDEADLVNRLRVHAEPYLAFVAVLDGEIVGHIAFTPVTLHPTRPDLDVRGLAPMAVLPAYQRNGIGTALVEAGLDACRRDGADAVVVLGHPSYYPRFGFASAASYGLRSEYDAPPEAFMALELTPSALGGITGIARYHPTFAE